MLAGRQAVGEDHQPRAPGNHGGTALEVPRRAVPLIDRSELVEDDRLGPRRAGRDGGEQPLAAGDRLALGDLHIAAVDPLGDEGDVLARRRHPPVALRRNGDEPVQRRNGTGICRCLRRLRRRSFRLEGLQDGVEEIGVISQLTVQAHFRDQQIVVFLDRLAGQQHDALGMNLRVELFLDGSTGHAGAVGQDQVAHGDGLSRRRFGLFARPDQDHHGDALVGLHVSLEAGDMFGVGLDPVEIGRQGERIGAECHRLPAIRCRRRGDRDRVVRPGRRRGRLFRLADCRLRRLRRGRLHRPAGGWSACRSAAAGIAGTTSLASGTSSSSGLTGSSTVNAP